MHTIASGYIKNRKCTDILLKEFRVYKKKINKYKARCTRYETKIGGLSKDKKDFAMIRNEMLEKIRELEEINKE